MKLRRYWLLLLLGMLFFSSPCAVLAVDGGAAEDMSVERLLSKRAGQEPFNGCSYNRGYRDGFKAGLQEGAGAVSSFPAGRQVMEEILDQRSIFLYLAFITGALFGALGVVLFWGKSKVAPRALLLCLMTAGLLAGCATKAHDPMNAAPVPVPPLKEAEFNPSPARATVPVEQQKGTTILVENPTPRSLGPRHDDPEQLVELLDMKSTFSPNDTAVKQLRPSAIKEAAHMVAMQTAIQWRYNQLLDAVYEHSAIMDTAFNFGPLMMTQGSALIMPPVLTRAGASMRIEDGSTATAASTSFELLQNAQYIPVAPNWRTYLMAEGFPAPEQPNPAVLPKNSEERAIWREAVREAWAQGLEEADELFMDNLSRMVRDYRGIMLYHLLTAQHLLTRVQTSQADLGMRATDNRLSIGQQVYRITSPSSFSVPKSPSQKRR